MTPEEKTELKIASLALVDFACDLATPASAPHALVLAAIFATKCMFRLPDDVSDAFHAEVCQSFFDAARRAVESMEQRSKGGKP